MTRYVAKTYLDVFRESKTEKELIEKVRHELIVACFFGNNPDMLEAIEDAMNTVAEEKGWSVEESKKPEASE